MSTVEKQKAQTMYGVEPYVESKGEEYMGEPMKKHFTKLLGAWKQELMTSVDRTVDHMKDEAANFPDPADRASQDAAAAATCCGDGVVQFPCRSKKSTKAGANSSSAQ